MTVGVGEGVADRGRHALGAPFHLVNGGVGAGHHVGDGLDTTLYALVAMAKLALAAPADCRSLGEGEAYDLDLAIEALVTAGAPRPQGSDDTVRPRG